MSEKLKTGVNEAESMTKLTTVQSGKDDSNKVTDTTPPPPGGMLPAGKDDFPKSFTPSLFKMPMGKEKHDRRIMDFPEFLKRINYRTHDGTLQAGHGQNLTGK